MKHRHLLDTARAMRLHANLPKKFWGDCVLGATYVINKLPIAKLGWKTPYEVLHGKVPEYENLKVIGYLCYAATMEGVHDKMDARGRRCVFLGYPSIQKGYKLIDLDTLSFFCSRDVMFHESVFPFKDHSSSSNGSDYVPISVLQGDDILEEDVFRTEGTAGVLLCNKE